MKFTVVASDFAAGLVRAQSVVEKRTTIPILANIKLETVGSELRLTATDLDIEIVIGVKATITEPGVITVPAHLLNDFIRKLPRDAEVKCEIVDDTLKVSSGRTRVTLQTLPAVDFPELSKVEASHRFDLQASDIATLFGTPRFAISTEETRYYLNGIYLHVIEDKMIAAATDGHRLAKIQMDVPAGAEGMPGIIVPRKSVLEILRLLDSVAETIKVELSNTKISMEIGSISFVSKLIDGTFPDYDRVIPKGNNTVADIIRADLGAAIDRVGTVADDKSRAVKFSFSNGKLGLSAKSETGTAEDEITVGYDAPDLEIGFNGRYVSDILAQLPDEFRIAMSDAGAPVVITSEKAPNATFVLMPMRV